MAIAYWEIGRQLYEYCGESELADYGKGLLEFISKSQGSTVNCASTDSVHTAMRWHGYSIKELLMTANVYSLYMM